MVKEAHKYMNLKLYLSAAIVVLYAVSWSSDSEQDHSVGLN